MNSHTDIAPDIVRRITEAADQLYEEGGSHGFPNVDAVRRRARANMNHASLVMREWRHRRAVPASEADGPLPSSLEPAGRQLLNALWREASAVANGLLQTAQAGWERERCELEEFRDQLAAAFDAQAAELSTACQAASTLRAQLSAQQEQISALTQRLGEAEARAGQAEAATAHATLQLRELHESLRLAQQAQQQLFQQLQDQHATAAAAAERNLGEQTRYAEQLGQARQEAASLRIELAAARSSTTGGKTAAAKTIHNPRPGKDNPP